MCFETEGQTLGADVVSDSVVAFDDKIERREEAQTATKQLNLLSMQELSGVIMLWCFYDHENTSRTTLDSCYNCVSLSCYHNQG